MKYPDWDAADCRLVALRKPVWFQRREQAPAIKVDGYHNSIKFSKYAANVKGKRNGGGLGHGWLMKGRLIWLQEIVARSGRRVADRDRRVACATHRFPFMSQPWVWGGEAPGNPDIS
jgi:hypothetical protein